MISDTTSNLASLNSLYFIRSPFNFSVSLVKQYMVMPETGGHSGQRDTSHRSE